jgi:FkbM family methyltransferase
MRQIIRNILQKFGYDIIKINEHSKNKASKNVSVKVGHFDIIMPGNNPQISNYKRFPDMNNQLGRLAKIVTSKYPTLTMIDVGANVGDTIAIVKSFVEIPIIGVEGDAATFSFLEKNSNQFKNTIIIKQFLGDETKTIKANLEKDGWNGTIIPSSTSSNSLELKTLDQTLLEKGLLNSELKILKVDVEGFDTIVLRGAKEIIKKYQPVLYFEYNRENMNAINEDGISTLLSLKELGYHNIIFFDNKNKYILNTTLDNTELITQLHNYADGVTGMIPYFDICIFSKEDIDLFNNFLELEMAI